MNAAAWYEDLKSGPGWSRLLVQHAPQLAVTALLIALAIECAVILTRSLGTGALPPAETGGLHTTPIAPRENPTVELATVLNAHLFGVAGVQPGGTAPQTTMPLVLAGVIANKDPSKGQAIIGDSAASAKLLAVGATIPGGARLNAVYGDRVLIDRNGRLETLMLPRNPMKSGGFQAAPPPAAAAQGGRENGALLAGLVRVQPVFEQNKLSGYHIFPGGPHGNSAFTQLGLRAGDLITAINGTPLDDAGRAMEVLQTLSSSASATVTVQRNGQSQELNLNLATLNTDMDSQGGENPAGTGPMAGGAPGPVGAGPMRARPPPVPSDAPPAANPAANSER